MLVHRGIYEAAKGIYQQLLQEVRNHLKSRGSSATLRFTGHSLGGSLSLLVSLMLLLRGEVPPSCLLPVVTFGSPYIMCGGDHLLQKLGLPQNHVQAIAMHRDIVPRAFSCSYPDYVAELLKAINGKFRDHPCLKNKVINRSFRAIKIYLHWILEEYETGDRFLLVSMLINELVIFFLRKNYLGHPHLDWIFIKYVKGSWFMSSSVVIKIGLFCFLPGSNSSGSSGP